MIIGIWIQDGNYKAEFAGGGLMLLISLIILDGGDFLVRNRKRLLLWLQIHKPFQKPDLRISIAYLLRIEVEGKYLLIKNDRGQNGFQPVGGVYKYFYPEGHKELQDLGVFTDNCISVDAHSEHDLRCVIDNRKKLFKFLKWFDKGIHRETDPWREFYEELVRSNILDERNFKYIQYEKVSTHEAPITYSSHFKIDEFLLADIYRPKFSAIQLEELKRLIRNPHPDILFATREEIVTGNSGNNLILPHSKKIFNNL